MGNLSEIHSSNREDLCHNFAVEMFRILKLFLQSVILSEVKETKFST